jgi:hypothetical protein
MFDDSVGIDADTPKASNFDDDSYRTDDVMMDAEPELPPPKVIRDDIQSTKLTSACKPKLPAQKTIIDSKKPQNKSVIPDDESSSDSDGDFPPLEQLSQSQPEVKREKSVSISSKAPTKADKEYQKAMAVLDGNVSEDEQSTPKASQQKSRKSVFKAPPPRASQSQGWPSRASVPLDSLPPPSQRPAASQPKPSAAQFIDLTQTSSDVEPEEDENDDGGNSSDIYLQKFRKPGMDDIDEDYNEDAGWVKKCASSQESRRHTSGGGSLRASSQASLNTRHGSTTSRF